MSRGAVNGWQNFLNLGNHPDCQVGDTTTFLKPRFCTV